MKKDVLKILFLLAFSSAFAQEKFGLKECITYGLENHRSTVISKNNIEQSAAARKQARAGYLPTVAINGSVDDNLKVQEQVIPAGLFGDEDIRVAFTKKYTATANVQLDQTIYDHSLIIGLKANKFKKQETEFEAVQNDEELVYNISIAYYKILVYRQQIDFLSKNREIYTDQVRILQLQVDKGTTAEVELNKVLVSLNNSISQLRTAQSNLAYSITDLKNSMGFPIDKTIDVITPSLEEQYKLQLSAQNLNFTAANRVDYKLSEINSSILEIEYKRLQATNIPKLSFYIRYGTNGFGDQLNQAFSSQSTFSALGIKLNAPIFSGFSKRAQYQQAKIDYMNSLENLKIDEANYRKEAENANTKLMQAQIGIDQERENIKLAESVLASTNLQYQKGVVGLTDWLNANFSLKEAQNNYLKSTVDYYVAQVELEKASGNLKTYYNNLK